MWEVRNSSSNWNRQQRSAVLWLAPPDFFSLLPYPGPPIQDGTTHSGLGSPIPIIIKKMPPACLQATVVEADVLFFFSTEISSFQKVLPSLGQVDKKVARTVLHSRWEHKGLATWSKSNFIQLRVCEHSQCPNNITRGYLSKRNQSPFKTCRQMRSVSILLAQKVRKTNIHWWRDKSKVATKNKTKTNPSH